jgi:hypothetical protein
MFPQSSSRAEVNQLRGLCGFDDRTNSTIDRKFRNNYAVESLRAQSLGWSPSRGQSFESHLESEVDGLLAEINDSRLVA